jgi:sterol desaturase/sphingolipid hydroxylase (fatty acid hydroxylase superfamily)
MEKIKAHTSNAISWSKTHEILFAPLPSPAADLPLLSRLHSERVYAFVDPGWIHKSRVFGGLYPRAPALFPEAEAAVDSVLENYLKILPGDWLGFMDYYAGPHYSFPGRYRILYTLLEDLWMAAARSGDRQARALAEGATRAYQDNYISHWDGPGKVRGWWLASAGGRGGWLKSDFPFYWEGRSYVSGPTPALSHSLVDHWLTGNRRAGDIARCYGEAFVQFWGPEYRATERGKVAFPRGFYMHLAPVVAVVVSVVAMDFVIYLQHVLVHAVPALWRLHRVHHADLDFDVTTGARFHPLEIILSMLIKLATIVVLGPPVLAVVIFEVLLNATAMFNHSNVRLPLGIDRVLRWIVVTPDMHRVHHSVEDDEANSNFGFNLPWWDRLFGTYRDQPRAGHEGMTIGIHTYRDPKLVSWLNGMLWLPFIGKINSYAINRRQWRADNEQETHA